MAKTACKILGIVLLLVGLVGFFSHNLLGLHLTTIHNIIHLVTGALALYLGFTGSTKATHLFCQVFGVVYLLVGLLGFISPATVESVLQIQTTTESANLMLDNIIHLILGAVFLVVGFIREPHATPTESNVR